jgi:hypothetical protein
MLTLLFEGVASLACFQARPWARMKRSRNRFLPFSGRQPPNEAVGSNSLNDYPSAPSPPPIFCFSANSLNVTGLRGAISSERGDASKFMPISFGQVLPGDLATKASHAYWSGQLLTQADGQPSALLPMGLSTQTLADSRAGSARGDPYR